MDGLDATHALLVDWLQRELASKPNKTVAVELLYIISIAKEYLKRLQTVGPDAVARLKSDNPFLHHVYSTYTENSPASRSVYNYLSVVHERVLDTIMNGNVIGANFLPTTLGASYRSVKTRRPSPTG